MIFDVIVSDPPWVFNDRLTMSSVPRGAEANYPTLDKAALCALKIPTAPNAILALWCPSSLLADGLAVMQAWGFTQKTTWAWVKTTKDGNGLAFGMGRTFRACHELALIGTKGSIKVEDKAQRSVGVSLFDDVAEFCPTSGHSTKPEALQDSLDLMFPDAAKLELFGRRTRKGWLVLGNEVTGNDIREDLANL